MGVLKDKDKVKVQEIFKDIDHEVTIVMFTQEHECPHCEMTRTMLEEVSGLSDKISLEVREGGGVSRHAAALPPACERPS